MGAGRQLKAGEYRVPRGASMREVVALLLSGRTVIRRLTVPEGLTTAEIRALLARAEGLIGEVPEIAEGRLLPETYHYQYGDDRAELVGRMRKAMDQALLDVWARRRDDSPLKTPEEVLTLASIIEKETGRAEDRADSSQVIAARFARNMRLQVDPTVIYGLGGSFNGNLTRADLKEPTPYNTYVHKGLPPTPIGLPGREALHAAVQPSGAPYLYFVSRGDGSSQFSTTLEEHRAAVNKYQRQAD